MYASERIGNHADFDWYWLGITPGADFLFMMTPVVLNKCPKQIIGMV